MVFKLRAIGSYIYDRTLALLTFRQPEVKSMTQERLREIINALKIPANQSQAVGNLEQNVGATFTVEEAVRQIKRAKAAGHKLTTADGIFTQDTINGLQHWGTSIEKASRILKRAVYPFVNDFKFILVNYQKLESVFKELTPKELEDFTNIVFALSKDTPIYFIDDSGKHLKAQVIDVHFAKDQFSELHQFLLNLTQDS